MGSYIFLKQEDIVRPEDEYNINYGSDVFPEKWVSVTRDQIGLEVGETNALCNAFRRKVGK
jgi:hypothetical protein